MTARTSECLYTFVYLFELPQLFCMPLGVLLRAFQLSACYLAYMLSLMTTSVSQLVYNLTHHTRVFLLPLSTLNSRALGKFFFLIASSTHNSCVLSSQPVALTHPSHPFFFSFLLHGRTLGGLVMPEPTGWMTLYSFVLLARTEMT
jgi:hypothetical protein